MSFLIDFGTLIFECFWAIAISFVSLFLSPLIFLFNSVGRGKRKEFKSILITGGNGGLGGALAKSLSGPQVQLVLLARNALKLNDVQKECEALGASVVTVSGSVTDKDALNTLLLQLDDRFHFDLVVANAGVTNGTLGIETVQDASSDIFDVNVHGVFNTIYPLMGRMRARKNGQIGIMSSMASFLPTPMSLEYHASKVAVRYVSEGLRPLLAYDNVGCTAICPGFVKSDITDKVPRERLIFLVEDPMYAAGIMKDALERNVSVCIFPYALYWLAGLMGHLPAVAREFVLARMTTPSMARKRLGPVN